MKEEIAKKYYEAIQSGRFSLNTEDNQQHIKLEVIVNDQEHGVQIPLEGNLTEKDVVNLTKMWKFIAETTKVHATFGAGVSLREVSDANENA